MGDDPVRKPGAPTVEPGRRVPSTPPGDGDWPGQATVEAIHRAYGVARWGPMLIVVWNGAVRGARIEPVIAAARENCQRYPDGGGLTLIVGENTGLPDATARDITSEALSELGGYIHSAAIVIDWDGFRAATARSAVSTMFFATGRRLTMRVFKNLEEATAWQAETVRCDPPFAAERYLRVVQQVRRQQAEHRTSAPPAGGGHS
ncbi:MAG: hypothetical protein ACOCV4_06670 [Myxococcota bacterium]